MEKIMITEGIGISFATTAIGVVASILGMFWQNRKSQLQSNCLANYLEQKGIPGVTPSFVRDKKGNIAGLAVTIAAAPGDTSVG
jgi:hypothetical protein